MAKTCQNMIFAFQDWSVDPFQKVMLKYVEYLCLHFVCNWYVKWSQYVPKSLWNSSGLVPVKARPDLWNSGAASGARLLAEDILWSHSWWCPQLLLTFRPFLDQLLNFVDWSDFRVKSSVHNSSCLVIEIPKPRNEAAASRTCSL